MTEVHENSVTIRDKADSHRETELRLRQVGVLIYRETDKMDKQNHQTYRQTPTHS